MTLAKIIPLFPNGKPPEPSCFSCSNGYYGDCGVLCAVFSEFIFDEKCAVECEAYEQRDSNDVA